MSLLRVAALPDDVLPLDAYEATLSNDLRVIVVPTGQPGLLNLQIIVKAGSRNDVDPGASGLAHFVEHLMMLGTPRYPQAVYDEIQMRAGTRREAETSYDYTMYSLLCAREDLPQFLEIEADHFLAPGYSEEAFRSEAGVVLAELQATLSDPAQTSHNRHLAAGYRVHPYGHPVLGAPADVERFPERFAYSQAHFRRNYRPERTTLLVVGDAHPEEVCELVHRHWGDWRPVGPAQEVPAEPPPREPTTTFVPWSGDFPGLLALGYHGPRFSSDSSDFEALQLLFELEFGESSELYRQLVHGEQHVKFLVPVVLPSLDPGLPTVRGRLNAGRTNDDVKRVLEAMLKTADRARRRSVSAHQLKLQLDRGRASLAHVFDNVESIAEALCIFVHFDRSYATLNDHYRRLQNLTPEHLQAAAERYLTDERLVATLLASEDYSGALSVTRRGADVRAATQPEAGARAPTVLLRSRMPLVRVKLCFTAGSAYDPPGKAGLAQLAAGLHSGAGSQELRREEIERALHPLAGYFMAHVDRELCTFTGIVHRDHLDAFADLALPQFFDPGLREEDFEQLRAAQLGELLDDLRGADEENLAKERLQCNLFAGTPYAHPPLGTLSSLEAVTVEDVRAFARRFYTRQNVRLGLAGDVPGAFLSRLEDAVDALPAGAPVGPLQVRGRRPSGMELEILEKDTDVVAISFGTPIDVLRYHEDYAALSLARACLGDHRSSYGRLYRSLRTDRGLTYGSYAYLEAFPLAAAALYPSPNFVRRAQLFEVWIRPVHPSVATFALKAAVHELRQLIAEGVTEQEFERFRSFLAKNVLQLLKTQEDRLGYAMDSAWFGMGDFGTDFPRQVAALSPSAVNQAIRRHLTATDLGVVLVARDAARLREELLDGATPAVRYNGPVSPTLVEQDRAISSSKLLVTPESVRITPVEAVFA
ncbi:MAG: insulinase family protein [Deltaproteobacteria bacterium]|nr:insulinase family protein [Deltaproteobacteria bacterium]